jgi:nitrile hydratase subunit beta
MSPRYKIGDRVLVRADAHAGHHRTPSYLKGKRGTVIAAFGAWRNPEELAYGKPGLPKQPLYMVKFEMDDVWGGDGSYAARDTVTADLYEHWLVQDGEPRSGSDA